MFDSYVGQACPVPQHRCARETPGSMPPHLLDTYRPSSVFPARQRSQRLHAAKHADLNALQRELLRPVSTAAPQRDDRGAGRRERSRDEPAHVDIPQTREEALVLLEQLQQVRARPLPWHRLTWQQPSSLKRQHRSRTCIELFCATLT